MPTSITVVQADGTIWTSAGFTQVTPPEVSQTVDVAPGETVLIVGQDSTVPTTPATTA